MLENQLGENGRLTDLFDPHTEGTPIAKLRKDIVGEIQVFRNIMMKKEGAEEVVAVTPLSGFAYEDELWEESYYDVCPTCRSKVDVIDDRYCVTCGERLDDLSASPPVSCSKQCWMNS
jgi:DNA-directed RNA polymerase subunit RPC12/RpoP